MLCFVVKHLEVVEHSISGEKHSTASCVFPYTLFVLYRFLRALQQSTVEASLLYLSLTANNFIFIKGRRETGISDYILIFNQAYR